MNYRAPFPKNASERCSAAHMRWFYRSFSICQRCLGVDLGRIRVDQTDVRLQYVRGFSHRRVGLFHPECCQHALRRKLLLRHRFVRRKHTNLHCLLSFACAWMSELLEPVQSLAWMCEKLGE